MPTIFIKYRDVKQFIENNVNLRHQKFTKYYMKFSVPKKCVHLKGVSSYEV